MSDVLDNNNEETVTISNNETKKPFDINKKIKLVIVGDSFVGKSAFLEHLLTGNFQTSYVAIVGGTSGEIKFNTTIGEVTFIVSDVSAFPREAAGIRSAYYLGAECAIIMFDTTYPGSYRSLPEWYDELRIDSGNNIPVVLCGNKAESKDRKIKPNMITFHRRKGIQYYDISVKSNFNLEKPFLNLIKILSGNNNVSLIPSNTPLEN